MNKRRTPYTLREKDGDWVAHALEFDLIGSAKSKEDAISQLKTCLGAQIAFGVKRGLGVSQCFFPAPIDYWIPPYEFMPLPSEEELTAFKFSPERSAEVPGAGSQRYEPDFCVCDYRPRRKCSVHPESAERVGESQKEE